eukprot:7000623-Prymnesium_polylepis.1
MSCTTTRDELCVLGRHRARSLCVRGGHADGVLSGGGMSAGALHSGCVMAGCDWGHAKRSLLLQCQWLCGVG